MKFSLAIALVFLAGVAVAAPLEYDRIDRYALLTILIASKGAGAKAYWKKETEHNLAKRH
ncbi:hypothetical protein QCA50_010411 [Cerrena zonata]|uniref:Uncharacterized protein n=1 Tax=Cerrena zonata TaxID=2478898 RepID=A0AAW0G998_9APHY